MLDEFFAKLEEDERERQARFRALPAEVQTGINRRAVIGQYVGPLAPIVDQFSSSKRAAATGRAARKTGGQIADGIAGAIRQLAKKPAQNQPQLASQLGNSAIALGRSAGSVLENLPEQAPAIGRGVLRAIPGIAAELTGVPAFLRAEQASQRADALPDDQRGQASLGVIGETAGGALAAIPLGKLAGSGLRAGRAAKSVGARGASPIGKIGTVGLAGTAGLAGLGSTDASAQSAGPESAESIMRDLLRDSQNREALDVSSVNPGSTGFIQGLSLNNYDDAKRQGASAKQRLEELRAAAQQNPTDTAIQLDLLRAERDYDPVSFAQRLDPEKFDQTRTAGEVVLGLGAAGLSTGLGRLIPGLKNTSGLVLGGIKGAAYGYGSGVGEVEQGERLKRAGTDAAISGAISGGVVPAAKLGARVIDHAPIHLQQAKNLATRLEELGRSGRLGPPPQRRAAESAPRLSAPQILQLAPNAKPGDAVRAALLADKSLSLIQPRSRSEAGPTERALIGLAAENPKGLADLNRQQNSQFQQAVRARLEKLKVPKASPADPELPADKRALKASALDFSTSVSRDWANEVATLNPAQRAGLARDILEKLKKRTSIDVLQNPELAARLNALGVRKPVPRGTASPDYKTASRLTAQDLVDANTLKIVGGLAQPSAPTKKARQPAFSVLGKKFQGVDPDTSARLARAINASAKLRYVSPKHERPIGEYFQTSRPPGYAPKEQGAKSGLGEEAFKAGLLSISVPLTDIASKNLFGLAEDENRTPIEAAQPGFLAGLALGENAQDLRQNAASLSQLASQNEQQTQGEVAKLASRRRQLQGQLRSAERISRITTGPDGEDLTRRAGQAKRRAIDLREQLAALETEDGVRERGQARLRDDSRTLNARRVQITSREEILRQLREQQLAQ